MKLRRIHWHVLLALVGLALAHPSVMTNVVGSGLVAAGLAVRMWAAGGLEKGGGLCTDGPYRYVRHPLYVGSFVAAVGFCVMMNVVWGWAVVLPLFVLLYAAQVSLEEQHLREKYGVEYEEYAARVPRVAPRLGAGGEGAGRGWRFSQALANREQYHVVLTLALVAAFYAKWHWGW